MFDPKVYCEACRELKAPEDKIEEIINMTEHTNQKARRPLRTALICAAAVAMMVVGVSAANSEEFQQFVYEIMRSVQVDEYRTDIITAGGEQVSVLRVPEAKVEKRDGRAVLVLDGEDKADITDELAENGHFAGDFSGESSEVSVEVDGTADDWTITMSVGTEGPDGDVVYTFTTEGDGESYTFASASKPGDIPDGYVSAFTYDGKDLIDKSK